MGIITKLYSISEWTNYTEVESIPNGLENPEVIHTTSNNRPCKISSFIDHDGNGYEIRQYEA